MIDFAPLIKDSPFAIYTCNEKGFITYYNSAASILWGRSPEIGKELLTGTQLFFPNGLPMPLESCPMAMTLKQGVAYDNQQLSIQRADGTFQTLRVFSRPVFDEQETLVGCHNTLLEPPKDNEQDTKSAILSAIVEHSDDAIISKDLNGIIKSWNKGAERIFGYTEAEAIGKSILMLIPQSRHHEEDLIQDSIRNGKLVDHFETIRIDKNGFKIPISLTISPIKNNEGLIIGASKVARDISKKHEDAAKQAILAAIVESSEDAVISKQLDGTITSWNEGAKRIFGYSEEEVVGKPITLLIPPSRFDEEQEIIESIKKGEKVDHFQTTRLHKNGYEINISVAVSPIKNIHGEIIGASKVARDITEQVRSQELIKKYTENLETLNAIGKSIAEKMDVETILQRVTDATTKITGAAFGAFFYNTLNEQGESYMLYTLSGAPRSAFENFGMPRNTAVFAPTFSGNGIIRLDDITKDPRYGHNAPHSGMPKGHLPVVSFLSVPVISNSGKVIGGLFFGHPEKGVFKEEHEGVIASVALQAAVAIDNSRLFEEVKSLSAKKDEFIALASHELKTPLTSIKGYLQLLYKRQHSEMEQRFLKKSLSQVGKLNMLIDDMLNMSRIEAGKLTFDIETFDFKELVVDVVDIFKYTDITHKIIKELPTEQIVVKADRQRLEQVLINLIGNAIKYSPKKEKIKVSLQVEGNMVTFRVKDYGIGLTAEQQKQLFSRFYRAESMNSISGLGLGLYLAKQIIVRHGGDILVNSEFGKGSEFYFRLPLEMTEG